MISSKVNGQASSIPGPLCAEWWWWLRGTCDVSLPPAFLLRSPVAHIHVALCQQKCLRKGEPVLSTGPTAFVKDEKTKPNTVHFFATFSRALHIVNVLRGKTCIGRASQWRISLYSHLAGIPEHPACEVTNWLSWERATGPGRPASCPPPFVVTQNGQWLRSATEARSVLKCHTLEEG